MSHKELGRASYTAQRFGNLTYLTAVGTLSNLTDKVDFEQLPTFVPPPFFAFYVIHAGTSLPATRPFAHMEAVVLPASSKYVHVIDAAGHHHIPIVDLPMPAPIAPIHPAGDTSRDNCVFAWLGINHLIIAKCDAVLPSVYTRVFGPDTLEACQRYVAENGGAA